MKKVAPLKTLLFLILLLPFNSVFAASENITISTYYPSPAGVYNTLRLFPGRTPPGLCQAGQMIYDTSAATPGYYVCTALQTWQLLGSGGGSSFWDAVPGIPNDIHNTNSGNVTVGSGIRDPILYVGVLDVRSDFGPALTWGNSTAIYGSLGSSGNYATITAGPGKNLILAGNMTDPLQQVTLTPSGNLGIGIGNPLEKLTVKGSLGIGGNEHLTSGLKLISQAFGIPQSMHIRTAGSPVNGIQTIWNGNWTGEKTGNALTSNAMYHLATTGNLSYNQLGYINTTGAFASANMIPILNITGCVGTGFIGIGNISSPSSLFTLQVAGNVGPDAATCDLGSQNKAWKNIYCYNPQQISGSDSRLKTNITDTPLGMDFVMQLRPVQFNWKKHDDGAHQGLIAQELEKTIRQNGIEFAGLRRDPESGFYTLDYLEFIAPMLKSIQEHQRKIECLQSRIKELARKGN